MTGDLSRAHLVERSIETLVADYERQDGQLEKRQVDRVIEKRGLSVSESQEVLDALEKAGIRFEDPDEDATSLEGVVEDTAQTGDVSSSLIERYAAAARQRNGGDFQLLTGRDELELGRAISLGQRAEEEIERGEAKTDLHETMIATGLAAKSRLTLANLRLVAHVARPFFHMSDLTADDVIHEGVLGLMRATEKFDYRMGLKFSTYATWWIRQAVTRAIADRGVTIRLPVYLTYEVHRFRRAYRLLHSARPARNPTLLELANELAWPLDRVAFIQHLNILQPVSLDEQMPDDPDTRTIDLIASEAERPDQAAERASLSKAVASAIAELSQSERTVLNLRFGLEDESGGRTLEEVGRLLSLTRERIRQIESKALKKLGDRARRRQNYALSSYCPDGWSGQDGVNASGGSQIEIGNSGDALDSKNTVQVYDDKHVKPQPFPREYRWLR